MNNMCEQCKNRLNTSGYDWRNECGWKPSVDEKKSRSTDEEVKHLKGMAQAGIKYFNQNK